MGVRHLLVFAALAGAALAAEVPYHVHWGALGDPEFAQMDITQWVQLPFAIGAAVFLLYLMQSLLSLVVNKYFKMAEDTVSALRDKERHAQEWQEGTFIAALAASTAAVQKLIEMTAKAEQDRVVMHDQIHGIVTELRVRPCLVKTEPREAKEAHS